MKRIIKLCCLVILGLVSASCDEFPLNGSFGEYSTLEELCDEMNENLNSLQLIVSAIEQGDSIDKVSAWSKYGVDLGYNITFNKSGTVSIYYGKVTSGTVSVPELGIKQDVDGVYCWTLKGKWILDDKGNKIPVSSSQGVSAITPKLKTENDSWYLSYDGGKTWNVVEGVATEACGCLFKDVKLTSTSLTMIFMDGAVLEIPIGDALAIVLGSFDAESIQYGVDVVIPYTVKGANGNVSVFVLTEGDLFEAELVKETDLSGKVIIRQDEYCNDEIDGSVAIFAAVADGSSASKSIRLRSGVLYQVTGNSNDSFEVQPEGGRVDFTIATNRDVEIKIGADWVTCADTKAVNEKTMVFDVSENTGARRKAKVEIISGDICLSFFIDQQGLNEPIQFNFTCDDVRGGSWQINVDTLFNAAGQSFHEALGYSSWDEVAQISGDYNALFDRTSDIKLLAYDLNTGEPFDYIHGRDALGFRYDTEGKPADVSVYSTKWDWLGEYREDGSFHIGKVIYINTGTLINAGEIYSFGILILSPKGEVRIAVTINVTEYIDPEKGLYENPASPGRYEFTLRDTIDVDNLMTNAIFSYEIQDLIKSTLGMTTLEISHAVQSGMTERNYILADNNVIDAASNVLMLDINGAQTVWDYNTMLSMVAWSYGRLPQELGISILIPCISYGRPLGVTDLVKSAVGKTISYDYVFRYNGYELIFTHKITYTGKESQKKQGYCLEMTNDVARDVWGTQLWYQFDEPLKAGTQYEFKCVAKSTSPYEWFPIWPSSSADYLSDYSYGMSVQTEWTEKTFIITPSTDTYDRLLFNYGDFIGTIYIDNISLKEVGSDVELIKNGDFEEGHTKGWGAWSSGKYSLSEYGDGYVSGDN